VRDYGLKLEIQFTMSGLPSGILSSRNCSLINLETVVNPNAIS